MKKPPKSHQPEKTATIELSHVPDVSEYHFLNNSKSSETGKIHICPRSICRRKNKHMKHLMHLIDCPGLQMIEVILGLVPAQPTTYKLQVLIGRENTARTYLRTKIVHEAVNKKGNTPELFQTLLRKRKAC